MPIRSRSQSAFSLLVVFLLILAVTAAADTVRLKNGRVIKGKVEKFENGEFVVIVEPSDPRTTGDRRILLVDSVESITFEAGGGMAAAGPSEKLVVLDAQKDVVPTGIQVRRGEKVRITASGEMQFPDGRVSGPQGLDTRESWPFPGERFGVLIGMVGDPQSTIYHVIGESSEFEARRDGELFLQINARSLQGARGAYTARIQSASTAAATPPPAPAPTTRRQLRYDVNVPADRDWTDSGIDLLAGDTLRVEAEGTINYTSTKTCGPNGGERDWKDLVRALPVNDVGRGALIGMIGQAGAATPFFIGGKEEFQVEKAGRLFLGVNDDDYRNNRGSFRVRVEIVPAAR